MATILMIWELGGGLGHLLPLRTLGSALIQRGHRVIMALRKTEAARAFFAGTDITLIQAPVNPTSAKRTHPTIGGYAHMLTNLGFGEANRLAWYFDQWNALFESIKPDLAVTDHSPWALLALRGTRIPIANLGLGFYCPPDFFPLPFWTPRGYLPPHAQMEKDEQPLLEAVNRLLQSNQRPTLTRMGQMFNQVDAVMLATYQELDPFGPRKEFRRYWGHWPADGGSDPVWPPGDGPRVFAYLKGFPALDALLGALKQLGVPSLIFAGELAMELRQRHPASTLYFEKAPVNVPNAAEQCQIAISNAGHGVLASLLLAGKPMLLFPLHTEQIANAQAVIKLGAGIRLAPNANTQVAQALREMVSTDRFQVGAQDFAKRYAGFTPGQQLPEIMDELEKRIRAPRD